MKKVLMIVGICCLCACSGDPKPGPLEKGWDAFTFGDYEDAVLILTEAKNNRPESAGIRAALGWSLLRTDDLENAEAEFGAGGQLSDPPADLFAGWAFALNALKDYGESNDRISEAMALDPDWVFKYDSELTIEDLMILKAGNHFLLGEFESSLSVVLQLNPLFSANVATDAGRGQLAAEIERLRSDL